LAGRVKPGAVPAGRLVDRTVKRHVLVGCGTPSNRAKVQDVVAHPDARKLGFKTGVVFDATAG